MFYEKKIIYQLERSEIPNLGLPTEAQQKRAQEKFMNAGVGPFETHNKIERRFQNELADDYGKMRLKEVDSPVNPVDTGQRFLRSSVANVFGKKGETIGRRATRLGLNFLTPVGIPYQAVKTGYETFGPNAKALGKQTIGQTSAILGHAWHRGIKPITTNTWGAGMDGIHMTANTGLGVVNTAATISGKIGSVIPGVLKYPAMATMIFGWDAPSQKLGEWQSGMSKWGGEKWKDSKNRYSAIPYDAGQIWQRGKNITTSALEAPGRMTTSAIPFAGPVIDRTLGEQAISPAMQAVRDSNFPERVFGKKEDAKWVEKYEVDSKIPKPEYEPKINKKKETLVVVDENEQDIDNSNVVSMAEFRAEKARADGLEREVHDLMQAAENNNTPPATNDDTPEERMA